MNLCIDSILNRIKQSPRYIQQVSMSIWQINEFRSQLPKIFLNQADLKQYYKDTTSPSYISELVSVDKNSCTDFSPLYFALLIGNVEFVQGVMLQLTHYLLQSQKPLLTPGYSPMLFQLGSAYKKVVNDILTNRFNSSGSILPPVKLAA